MKLADPQSFATDQVVNLSGAIRREIASMGDGLECALARASELETMVRGEVSNLERSYSDNERRMRQLIDELTAEREAVLSSADRVRLAMTSSQDTLARDLEQLSQRIAQGEIGRAHV